MTVHDLMMQYALKMLNRRHISASL